MAAQKIERLAPANAQIHATRFPMECLYDEKTDPDFAIRRDRRAYLGAYGHYQDELRRVDGEWRFTRRQIFNEQRDSMAASDTSPAW
jgi:hypothetical protein